MSSIKHWDNIVQNAGLDNIASFLDNVTSMWAQEMDALRCAAVDGMSVVIFCPYCHQKIENAFSCDLGIYRPTDGPPTMFITLTCELCDNIMNMNIVPASVEKSPF